MAAGETAEIAGLSPVLAIAVVGVLGVGSQWLAWRLRLPAIVLMLLAGVIAGPVLGVFDPDRDIGPLTAPLISLAVAVILFEGGLTLNFHSLRDAAEGVKRLVFIGAPLGWLTSTLALHYGAGLSWESSAVFGGIMIVTGPTVIAPMLRTARLARRPAALLQWEAIVNDPIGALAAVLAFQAVLVLQTAESWAGAALQLGLGIGFAAAVGGAGGLGLAWAFRRARVPDYMKVPVLFATLLAVFALSDMVLHESGLLAVTVMGIVIANANLSSFTELRRFKEHATILLVSGVFILLAASLDFAALRLLDWRAAVFVALVVLVARPLTVMIALTFTALPVRERVLVALTGPRGVVLVAVAGLFGTRLVDLGVSDGGLIAPLAFLLVSATVVIHGFTLAPFARRLGLIAAEVPGVLLVGGSLWSAGLARALHEAGVPVMVTDPNRDHLREVREAGLPNFFGDILSEAAELRIEIQGYSTIVAATDNDAYNTLVATDLAAEFGRENIWQVSREKGDSARHTLPATLGGQQFRGRATFRELNQRMWDDWKFRVTRLTTEFTVDAWRDDNPDAMAVAVIDARGEVRFVAHGEGEDPADLEVGPDERLLWLGPERDEARSAA